MPKASRSRSRRKSAAWYQRHVRDAHVRRAKAEGKRSRAAFKLTEILDRFSLLPGPEAAVVELGCAPGSWTAEIAARLGPHGLLIGVDRLGMEPVEGASFIQGDIMEPGVRAAIEQALEGRPVDLVLSDMAPDLSGNRVVDQARMSALNELTLDFAVNHLRRGGSLLLKSFQGSEFEAFRKEMQGWFATVRAIKPRASRKESSEIYLLGLGFRTA